MPHVSNPPSYLDDTKAPNTYSYPHFQMKRLRHRKAKEAFWIMHWRWTRVELESYPRTLYWALVYWSVGRQMLHTWKGPWRVLGAYSVRRTGEEGIFYAYWLVIIVKGVEWEGEHCESETLVKYLGLKLGDGSVDKNACPINTDSQHPHKSWVWRICNPRVGDRQRQADPQLTSQIA